MAGARNARHPGKRPAANEHEDQAAAAANKPDPKPGSKPKTGLELLGSATNTPSMPRKRKSSAGFPPFGRAPQAGKQGGADYRQKEGKQIESSGSKQDVVSAVQGRIESIADQLGPADARFVQAIASCMACMGNAGGAVVQQLMADLAAASGSERAEEAEARAAELEGQIQEFQFQSAQRFRRYTYWLPSSCSLVPIRYTRKRRVVFLWLVLGTCTTGSRPKSATRAETRAETAALQIFDSNKRFCWLKRASLG
jgi:hypothetical protein